MTTGTLRLESALFVGALLLGLVVPAARRAEPRALDWETGAGKSYLITGCTASKRFHRDHSR